MFAWIVNNAFPLIGNALGALVGFAQTTSSELREFFKGGSLPDYTNLYTGEVVSGLEFPLDNDVFKFIGNILYSPIASVFHYFGYDDVPLWLSLLMVVFFWGLIFVVVRGIYKYIKGWF